MDGLAPPPAPPETPATGPEPHDPHGHGVVRADVAAVGSVAYQKLYKKREPIYPKTVKGTFRTIKWWLMGVLLGVYYLVPWIRWDRPGERPDQAVLVDFEGRRFYFGPIELWPQEVYYITGLLVLAAMGLFLVTALFGRLWCGYACPQTVWTDLYLLVERWIEGERSAQIRLAKAPWGPSKIGKKLAKHAIWILIALATGGAWVFYFGDAPTLTAQIFTGAADPGVYLFIGILTFTTYALAGTMREQVCTYMCPWPRIQAAMIDKETLNVTYRADRGEPRGPHKKGTSWEGRGDCIDCNQCVAACPQGIDIREGAQLECINCALCIDACDEVMKRVGRPTGLIGYDTDINIARRRDGLKPEFHFNRYRTWFYVAVIAGVGSLMLYSLVTRQLLDLNVIRDRNPAFVRLSDGGIRNGYTVKILNMKPDPREVTIRLEGEPTAELKTVSGEMSGRALTVRARGDGVTEVHVYVVLPRDALRAKTQDIAFVIEDPATGETDRNPTAFLTGFK